MVETILSGELPENWWQVWEHMLVPELIIDAVPAVGLPRYLRCLTIDTQSLYDVILPKDLQQLTFGPWFNQNLDNVALPSGLQQLTFGVHFNQSLDNVTLPNSLQQLTFDIEFNQSLDNATLPNSLQQLTFGYSFDQSLENVTPGSFINISW